MDRDPLQDVSPGEPFEPAAETWNAFLEATRLVRKSRVPPAGGGGNFDGIIPALTIKVKNTTGTDILRYGILGFKEPVIKPAANEGGALESRLVVGITPDPTLPFLIAERAIKAGPAPYQSEGAIGRGAIAGMTWVRLNVLDESHQFAIPTNSTTMLDTAAAGPARIVWKEPVGSGSGPVCSTSGSGSDCRWGLVILGGGGGGATSVVVRVIDIISIQNPACGSGIGSGSCVAGSGDVHKPQCLPLYHHAVIQIFDSCCGDWMESTCAVLMEVNAKRLVIGDQYTAILVGSAPKALEAANVPVGSVCKPGQTMPLYAVDAGSITRRILVESHLGKLCLSAASGSIGTVGQGGLAEYDIYRGIAVRKNLRTCKWEPIEDDVLIAHLHGCALDLNAVYQGNWDQGVPNSLLSVPGSGTALDLEYCTPLYITTDPTGDVVTDVLCVGGVAKVFKKKQSSECEGKFSNNAGCCNCRDGGSESGSGAGTCICDGNPTAAQFSATASGLLTNGSCTNCASFNLNFTLTYVGGCEWDSSTMFNPCGGSASGSVVANSDGSADLNIGGAGNFSAHYHCASFACNGVNTFNYVSSQGGCTNWPATYTLTPV